MTSKLPKSASVASQGQGGKMHAPAAARNVDVLSDLLLTHAPITGGALEIASGTGQHICAFAQAMPQLKWQPTEIAADRLASINAYAAEAGLTNLEPAQSLDATRTGWHGDVAPRDLIVLVNLLHLVSDTQARTVITESVAALVPQGRFVLYGPFKRSGQLVSKGDAGFDADLRAADPAIGYKDDTEIMNWLTTAGASAVDRVVMPANNLAFIATR